MWNLSLLVRVREPGQVSLSDFVALLLRFLDQPLHVLCTHFVLFLTQLQVVEMCIQA